MTQSFPRARLEADPTAVLLRLPMMGKLMVTAKHGGATHERIGIVERADIKDGWLICSGADHDCRIALGAIASVTVDRTSIMGGAVYPRLDFLRPDGEVIFSIVGFAGLEPFDDALRPLGPGIALPPAAPVTPGERPEVSLEDPGARPFSAAIALATSITIAFSKPGFEQRWQGVLDRIKPAMGFNNIMYEDFHLHLRAGAVDAWHTASDSEGYRHLAVAPDGAVIGLSVLALNGLLDPVGVQ